LFGIHIGKKEELEDMSTVLAFFKKRIDNCAKRLPDKRNIDHLELFSKSIILELEDKMSLIIDKLDSCEK
jgi:hypothetical protein